MYHRRTRRRDVTLISDIQLLPADATPFDDGIWTKAALTLRDGVVRAPSLFLWYQKDKMLADMLDGERQSLTTELDVIYGAGDPWYGFEKLTPPATEKSANTANAHVSADDPSDLDSGTEPIIIRC